MSIFILKGLFTRPISEQNFAISWFILELKLYCLFCKTAGLMRNRTYVWHQPIPKNDRSFLLRTLFMVFNKKNSLKKSFKMFNLMSTRLGLL